MIPREGVERARYASRSQARSTVIPREGVERLGIMLIAVAIVLNSSDPERGS